MKITILFFTFFILGVFCVLIMNETIGIDFYSSFLKNVFVTFKVMSTPEYGFIVFFLLLVLYRPLSLLFKQVVAKNNTH